MNLVFLRDFLNRADFLDCFKGNPGFEP